MPFYRVTGADGGALRYFVAPQQSIREQIERAKSLAKQDGKLKWPLLAVEVEEG